MPNTPTKLSDGEAKALLRKWPAASGDVVRTRVWATPHGRGAWLRAQPKDTDGAVGPKLYAPGAKAFSTQPDGLWVWFDPGLGFVDILVVEVCGSTQNLNDKRSRYGPSTTSQMLNVPRQWWTTTVVTRGGGRKQRCEVGGVPKDLIKVERRVPVRWTQVLYALPNALYRTWTADQIPGPHEYFCRHGSMGSYTEQSMQALLARMTLRSHFLTEPGK